MIRRINGITYNPPQTIDGRIFTATTSESVLLSVEIPANTFSSGESFGIQTCVRKVTTNSGLVVRLRIGTTESVSDPLVAVFSSTTASNTLIRFDRRINIISGISDTRFLSSTTNSISDIAITGSALPESLSINWGVLNFISLTVQSISANEGVTAPYMITDFLLKNTEVS